MSAPEDTAVRAALWRALHVEADPPPRVFEDDVGLKLAAPDEGWRSRPDMSPFRVSIVARARFIEDLVAERAARGVQQYVILGAGLDTFAQRRPEIASRLLVFEIDQPGPQAWKRQRLIELGFGVPSFLRFVPVAFEAGDAWWDRLVASGFDSGQAAIVASAGVSIHPRGYSNSPATSGSRRSSTYRPRRSPSATSRAGPMVSVRRTTQRSCWSRLPDSIS